MSFGGSTDSGSRSSSPRCRIPSIALPPVGSRPHRNPAREAVVRELVTPAVYDIVTGAAICAGPELDEPRAWAAYRKAHPERVYAVAKRQLARAELRRHGLTNVPLA